MGGFMGGVVMFSGKLFLIDVYKSGKPYIGLG